MIQSTLFVVLRRQDEPPQRSADMERPLFYMPMPMERIDEEEDDRRDRHPRRRSVACFTVLLK